MTDALESKTHQEVQRYYGETLESSADLKTTACCTAAAPPDYAKAVISQIHEEVLSRYYGCGLVLPEAMEGMRVLDLGCGAGRDVYILSALVGEQGSVVGVDMTPEQLAVAEQYRAYHADRFGYAQSNVEFLLGNIEKLDELSLENESFDLIISNCVINLAVDKAAVLQSAERLLKVGGEMYFSDIYADRRVPEVLRSDPVLYGECLSGAMYWNDFLNLSRVSGFAEPLEVVSDFVAVTDPELSSRLGGLQFCSTTYRLFKLKGAEPGPEDYGQTAIYMGSIDSHAEAFDLDAQTRFITGEEVPISGNTARLLQQSRFENHFEVFGDNSVHLGPFGSTKTNFSFPVGDELVPSASCCG